MTVADSVTMAILHMQTARQHPEWFDTGCYPAPTPRERRRARKIALAEKYEEVEKLRRKGKR